MVNELTPRQREIALAMNIVDMFDAELRRYGMSGIFLVLSRLHLDPVEVKVFRKSQYGDPLYPGSKDHGFEFLRIEIGVGLFGITIFGRCGGQTRHMSLSCANPEPLLTKVAKESLFFVLYNYSVLSPV